MIIQINSNRISTKVLSTILLSFPMDVVLLYLFTSYSSFLSILICIALIILFGWLNIWFNFFDYSIFYDSLEKCFIVTRFGRKIFVSNNTDFKVKSLGVYASSTLGNFVFLVDNKKFRFRNKFINSHSGLGLNLKKDSEFVEQKINYEINIRHN